MISPPKRKRRSAAALQADRRLLAAIDRWQRATAPDRAGTYQAVSNAWSDWCWQNRGDRKLIDVKRSRLAARLRRQAAALTVQWSERLLGVSRTTAVHLAQRLLAECGRTVSARYLEQSLREHPAPSRLPEPASHLSFPKFVSTFGIKAEVRAQLKLTAEASRLSSRDAPFATTFPKTEQALRRLTEKPLQLPDLLETRRRGRPSRQSRKP